MEIDPKPVLPVVTQNVPATDVVHMTQKVGNACIFCTNKTLYLRKDITDVQEIGLLRLILSALKADLYAMSSLHTAHSSLTAKCIYILKINSRQVHIYIYIILYIYAHIINQSVSHGYTLRIPINPSGIEL